LHPTAAHSFALEARVTCKAIDVGGGADFRASGPLALTATPGTAAPEGSATVPVMPVSWAESRRLPASQPTQVLPHGYES